MREFQQKIQNAYDHLTNTQHTIADFFLEHIDHGQEQAVNLAYEFYKLSKADYFVLSSFLPFLEKEMAALKQTGRGKEHGWCVSGEYTESGGRNGGEGDSGDWSCRSTVGARITLPANGL